MFCHSPGRFGQNIQVYLSIEVDLKDPFLKWVFSPAGLTMADGLLAHKIRHLRLSHLDLCKAHFGYFHAFSCKVQRVQEPIISRPLTLFYYIELTRRGMVAKKLSSS
jgi:hypothetical protein